MQHLCVFLRLCLGVALLAFAANAASAQSVDTLYPNLCPRSCNLEVQANEYVHPDTVLFWFQNGLANIGKGELYLKAGDTLGTDPQTAKAIQRLRLSTGDTLWDTIGNFVYDDDPSHDHWHFQDFVQYRLLEIVADTGIGDTLIESPKSGFCLTDVGGAHNSNTCLCGPIEGDSSTAVYTANSCLLEPPALFMGISVGQYDVYGFNVEGQSMNIVGIANGSYWLESTLNANDNVQETSTSNNVVKVKVNIISEKDTYEPNDTSSAIDTMALGGTNSSNLAACAYPIVIDSLNIDQETNYAEFFPDEDWFRFRVTETADSTHYVKITFDQDLGDLELELLDASDSILAASDADAGDSEYVSLSGRLAGWYYARVYGDEKFDYGGGVIQYDINWYYKLEINAPDAICGDANGDGVVNSADVLHFNAGCYYNTITCDELADVDGNCGISCYSDGNYLLDYVFSSGPAPDCECE